MRLVNVRTLARTLALDALARQVRARLRARYALARAVLTPDQHAAAVGWYDTEGLALQGVAYDTGVPFATVVACAAALSPGNTWAGLKRRLPGFVELARETTGPAPAFPTYGRNRIMAAAIVRERAGQEALKGPKVRAFAQNLLGNGHPVTVDRHVVRMSLGVRKIAPTVLERSAITVAFTLEARDAGMRPCDYQALLWCATVWPKVRA